MFKGQPLCVKLVLQPTTFALLSDAESKWKSKLSAFLHESLKKPVEAGQYVTEENPKTKNK